MAARPKRANCARRSAEARAGLMLVAEMLPAPLEGGPVKKYALEAEGALGWTRTRNIVAAAVEAGLLELVQPADTPRPAVYRVTLAGQAEIGRAVARLRAVAQRMEIAS